jgi:hypothetical protein
MRSLGKYLFFLILYVAALSTTASAQGPRLETKSKPDTTVKSESIVVASAPAIDIQNLQAGPNPSSRPTLEQIRVELAKRETTIQKI